MHPYSAQNRAAVAGLQQAKAQLVQAQADLNRARLNLEYCNIYSPVDGVVISRNVDVGQTIAASLQSPTLFTIANDLTRMQVNANVDEADIGSISDQADVRFTVDAYPNEFFRGRISEIRLNPQTVQNVVKIFQRLNRDRNLTIIVVTHEPDIAQYANRIIQFRDGRIRRDFAVENRKDAREVLMQLPRETEDEDEECGVGPTLQR